MNMTYATILVFVGENKRLYKETKFSYVVSDHNNSINHPIYAANEDLGYCILLVNKEYQEALDSTNPVLRSTQEIQGIWMMYFDGEYSKEGVGVGVVLMPPPKKKKKSICPTNWNLKLLIM